jgi:hypothetical protein
MEFKFTTLLHHNTIYQADIFIQIEAQCVTTFMVSDPWRLDCKFPGTVQHFTARDVC